MKLLSITADSRVRSDVLKTTSTPTPKSLGTPWSGADLWLVAAIALAAFLVGRAYLPVYQANVGVSRFYQEQFGPAIMLACGRGFVDVSTSNAPPLAAFLAQRVDRFRCEELPRTVQTELPNPFQRISLYLLGGVALVWKATGISWTAVDAVEAGLFAVTVSAAYVALRFIAGRGLALFVTMLWTTSAWHLRHLSQLRDYSKAPFFVLMLVAAGVAFVERRLWPLVALGAIFGIVHGIGYGMRADVALNFIPFLAVLFAGTPDGLLKNLKAKAACAAAAIAMFFAVAYPILTSYRDTGLLWHVTLLGLTSPFDTNLTLTKPLPPYNFGYRYDDSYVEAVVNSHWSRLHPDAPPIPTGTPGYGQACRSYYATLAATFPGDVVTRMTAASLHVFELPFSTVFGPEPLGLSNRTLVWLSEKRTSLMRRFEGTGLLAVAGVLLLLGIDRPRYAAVAFVVLMGCAVVPSLQYQYRHVFHLEFLILGAITGGLALIPHLVRRFRSGSTSEAVARSRRSIATVSELFAVVLVALLVARAVQARRARAFIASYATAPVEQVPTVQVPLGDGRVRLAAEVFGMPSARDEIQTRLVAAEFDSGRCDTAGSAAGSAAGSIEAIFQYERDPSFEHNFFCPVTVPRSLSGRPTRVFLPVYQLHRDGSTIARFIGVDVPEGGAACVRLFRVRDVSGIPALLPVTLTPDWETQRLFQRLPLVKAMPPRVWLALSHRWPGVAEIG